MRRGRSQRHCVLQFVDRFFILALGGECDGVPLQQARLFRRRSQTAFEISAGCSGCAGLHFSDSRQEVSVGGGASVVVQLNFGELHLVDAVALQDAVAQGNPVRLVLPGSAWDGHLEFGMSGVGGVLVRFAVS